MVQRCVLMLMIMTTKLNTPYLYSTYIDAWCQRALQHISKRHLSIARYLLLTNPSGLRNTTARRNAAPQLQCA